MDKNTQINGTKPQQIHNDNLQQNVQNPHGHTSIELESGKTALTLQPGKIYPLSFMEILAGDTIENYNIDTITRILTPFVPTFDKVMIRISAYFVPLTRIWASAEKVLADKASIGNTLNGASKSLPSMIYPRNNTLYNQFRDTLVARYGLANQAQGTTTINPFLMRGYRAITNDYIINKEYEAKYTEWNNDTVTTPEYNSLLAYDLNDGTYINRDAYIVTEAPTTRNYLTNIKLNIDDNTTSNNTGATGGQGTQSKHLDWQTKFMKAKQDIANANKNDWDIIADMGGTEPVEADRTQFLGEVEYEMNYQQITQSAPEIDGSAPLGTTGSFSYTRAQGELFSYKEFKQHGHVHVLVSVFLDKGFEEATPKELLKINNDDIFRPSLAKKEVQFLYRAEVANVFGNTDRGTVAFQPAWAEYKRLPRIITGEMRTKPLIQVPNPNGTEDTYLSQSHWHNFGSGTIVDVVANGNYFRPFEQSMEILARNNALQWNYLREYVNDMIMQMAEVKVRMKRPIDSTTLQSTSKANTTR